MSERTRRVRLRQEPKIITGPEGIEQEIYNLNLGDELLTGDGVAWMRVPGGWIVQLYNENDAIGAATFIPYNGEFEPGEGEPGRLGSYSSASIVLEMLSQMDIVEATRLIDLYLEGRKNRSTRK